MFGEKSVRSCTKFDKYGRIVGCGQPTTEDRNVCSCCLFFLLSRTTSRYSCRLVAKSFQGPLQSYLAEAVFFSPFTNWKDLRCFCWRKNLQTSTLQMKEIAFLISQNKTFRIISWLINYFFLRFLDANLSGYETSLLKRVANDVVALTPFTAICALPLPFPAHAAQQTLFSGAFGLVFMMF